MTQIICYPNCVDQSRTETLLLEQVANLIRGEKLRTLTERLRSLLAEGHKERAGDLKRKAFPALMPACICRGRRTLECMTHLTGLCQIDFDHLTPTRVEELMARLPQIPEVLLGYRTVSGCGVHLYYQWTATQLDALPYPATEMACYTQAFRQGNEYIASLLGEEYDASCEPPVKLSILCHDHACYFHPEAIPFVPDMAHPIGKRNDGTLSRCERALLLRLRNDSYTEGNRHNFLFRLACLMADMGVDEQEALQFVAARFADYRDEPLPALVADAYRHVGFKMPRTEAENAPVDAKTHCVKPLHTHTRARTIIAPDENEWTPPVPEEQDAGKEVWIERADPTTPLPHFAPHRWPRLLEQMMAYGHGEEQRDVLLLSAFTAIGATLGTSVRTLYARKWVYPCLQTFVMALPASGKGVIVWLRRFVEPIHIRIRREVEREMKRYRKEKAAYDAMGRNRGDHEQPEPPANRMFLIPGNNTGTGIMQNIIESGGTGFLCEEEADTVASAISGEYGKWSDTLRKLFDQERLSYNRRTNQEYREVGQTCVGVEISGTPDQLKALIPSAGNGLFSRQVFYYMQHIKEWQSQFEEPDGKGDVGDRFFFMGCDWMKVVEALEKRGVHTLYLTPAQQQAFDDCFRTLFRRAKVATGCEMGSSVARLAMNLMRILSVVALLRAVERGTERLLPDRHVHAENRKDGVVGAWALAVEPDDFQAVLQMAGVLYRHATHVLSFLEAPQVRHRQLADRDLLLSEMPDEFMRQEFVQAAMEQGIPASTAGSWLARSARQGQLERTARGGYRKK